MRSLCWLSRTNSHERGISQDGNNTVNSCRTRYFRCVVFFPFAQVETPANAHVLFTTPCPQLYRYTLISTLPHLSLFLFAVDEASQQSALVSSTLLLSLVASLVHSLLLVLFLPLSQLGLLRTEVIAEPLLDA